MARARYDKHEIREAFDCRKYLAEKHGVEPDGKGLYKAPWDEALLLKVAFKNWHDASTTGRKQDCFALVGNCLGLDWGGKDFATVIRAAAEFCGVEPEEAVGDDDGTGLGPTNGEEGMGAWVPSLAGPPNGYVALYRSQATYDLLKGDAKAFVLLTFIALRARWSDSGLNMDGVEVGQAFLGDHREYGMTRGQYREALKRLTGYRMLSAIRATNRGTVVTLGNRDIYDPMMGAGNQRDDQPHSHQATIKQPSSNHQTTTKKKGKTARRGNSPPSCEGVSPSSEKKEKKISAPSGEGEGSSTHTLSASGESAVAPPLAECGGLPGEKKEGGGEQAADGGQERETGKPRIDFAAFAPPEGWEG